MLEHPPRPTKAELKTAIDKAFTAQSMQANAKYPYWDKVKYINADGFDNSRQLWFALKHQRQANRTQITIGNLKFSFTITVEMLELLHFIDTTLRLGPENGGPVLPAGLHDAYLVSSLMEEAIASSLMEGATTTRRLAKEMLRNNTRPKDTGQQMVMNNYQTISLIKTFYNDNFSIPRLLEIHREITLNTLADDSLSGRFRTDNSVYVVNGISGIIAHKPPTRDTLDAFMDDIQNFFNNNAPTFIHPVIQSIIVHFMLSYAHPFVDGNGRTARSLFHWHMLKNGYPMVEHIAVSRAIYKSKSTYEKAFLYTEYDNNDLTYFILYNLRSIKKAYDDFIAYLSREATRDSDVQRLANNGVNDRQARIVDIVRRDPAARLTVVGVQTRFAVSNYTARADLERLVQLGYLSIVQVNKVKRVYVRSEHFLGLVDER